jgi:hypothetical protein
MSAEWGAEPEQAVAGVERAWEEQREEMVTQPQAQAQPQPWDASSSAGADLDRERAWDLDQKYACRSSDSGSEAAEDPTDSRTSGPSARKDGALSPNTSGSSNSTNGDPASPLHKSPFTMQQQEKAAREKAQQEPTPEQVPSPVPSPEEVSRAWQATTATQNAAAEAAVAAAAKPGTKPAKKKSSVLRITNVPTTMPVAGIRLHFKQFGEILGMEYTYSKRTRGCAVIR